MNDTGHQSDDPQLSSLLRQARTAPALPPRFQQNVWRRLEAPEPAPRSASWLDALASLVLRPAWHSRRPFCCSSRGRRRGRYRDGKWRGRRPK